MASTQCADDHYNFTWWSVTLANLYSAWNATNAQFTHVPLRDSPASRDDEVLAQAGVRCTKYEGTGAGLDAVQMIDAAAQYTLALKSLADNRTPILAPWPIARAIAEHVAYAAWLLEPGISADARMARRWMARLAAAHRYRWMVSARNASRPEQREAKKVRDQIRRDLLQRFPDAETEWDDPTEHPHPPWTIAGEVFPTLGHQCRLIEKLGVDSLSGVYDVLSFLAHPNSLALTMQIDRQDNGDHTTVTYRANPEHWNSAMRLASMLLYVVGSTACSYYAVETQLLDEWYDSFEP
ncbi:hypothetical protein [Mycobacterium sp. 48b]|uniref:hypothetical protein n=1 Tax=Mycobacterium sp. 48b TaxID=3400426 RepID=UPI003AAB42A4